VNSQLAETPLDLTRIGERETRSPLLKHLENLENLAHVFFRKALEEFLHRSLTRFVLIELYLPTHSLNDISVQAQAQP
jgi:hypothetical protein